MGELASTLDALGALAADDLFELSDADLLDRTRDLVRARNMLDAELARTTRRAELAQAAEHDGLKSMKSWLRSHARLSGSRSPAWSRPAGRRSTCRRWPPPARPGRSPPTRSSARPDHHARGAGRGPPPPGSTWPRSRPRSSRSRSRPRTGTCRRPSAPTWPRWTPTARNPTPPRAGRCPSSGTPTGRSPAASPSTLVGGEKVATALESIAAAQPLRRGQPHPRAAPRRRAGPAGRPVPGLR